MENAKRKKGIAALLVGSAVLALSYGSASYAETEQQTRDRMVKEAKESADRAEKKADKESGGKYEVKKSHDEHIKATEKAAADAQRKKKK